MPLENLHDRARMPVKKNHVFVGEAFKPFHGKLSAGIASW